MLAQDDVEVRIIEAYRAEDWSTQENMPGCSTSEQITVALSLGRNDFLPDGWPDSLNAYMQRLDDRQRMIVDHYRTVGEQPAPQPEGEMAEHDEQDLLDGDDEYYWHTMASQPAPRPLPEHELEEFDAALDAALRAASAEAPKC